MFIKGMEIPKFLKMIKMSQHLVCISKDSNYPVEINDIDIEFRDNMEDKEHFNILKKY